MKVSVAMAYYNGGEYINEQLSSILSQLGEEDEVILSVDAADDGSEKLLKKRAEEDARIHLLRGPGKGVVKNFASAIAHCSGDVIFLSDQDDIWWVITYVLIGVWQSMGWGTIIYLAAITGVNPELYEAARVDGAGRWKQCWHVTLPGIRSAIVTLLIMNLGRVMQGSFERIFALMNAKATEFTTTIPVLVYRWGIEGGKFSEATALGLFQSVIGLILVLASDYVAKRMGEEGLI